MLSRHDLRRFAERFGVPDDQIVRDHLISHVLAALPALGDRMTFFGGTALCRTHLLDWRLSEDIDLLVEDPASWREALTTDLPRALRREFPGLEVAWTPRTPRTPTQVGFARTSDAVVRLQLVGLDDSYRRYPVGPTPVALRYPDLPAHVVVDVPTLPAATAMKLNAWAERGLPRDLADLLGLEQAHGISPEAIRLAREVASALVPHTFSDRRLPGDDAWRAALEAQMARVPDRVEALHEVRTAVARAAGWDDAQSRW